MTKLSIVVPVYQNGLSLPSTYAQLKAECERHRAEFDYELLFIDDGSTDDSRRQMRAAFDSDPGHVVLIHFARNFGQVPAMIAGFSHATGDCVMTIAADLQEPPELVGRLFESWSLGNKLVIATRSSREDGLFRRLVSLAFFAFWSAVGVRDLLPGGFDCWLMDRQLIEPFLRRTQRTLFFHNHVMRLGSQPTILFYHRRKRALGESQYTVRKKLGYVKEALIDTFPILNSRKEGEGASPRYEISSVVRAALRP